MNRKEAIEIIKNSNIYGARMNGKNLIIEAINELVKDITLSDFLGWDEGVEYEVEDKFYIMKFLDLPKHYKLKCKLYNDSLELSWKGGYTTTRELHLIIDELKQATKVEPKLKAYHVKDEYSYNELMKELEEQGCTSMAGTKPTELEFWENHKQKTVIYCDEDKSITYSHLSYYETDLNNKYELIEYYKEEPKFYAKIKGWELTKDDDCYWYKDENPIHGIYPWSREEASIYTKTEWNKLGINDTNADFEEIKEVQE